MSEKKVKFTVVDAVIIVVVLAAVVIGAVKFLPSVINPAKTEKVDFTVLLQNEDETFADAVTVGDRVTISLTEKDGGTVKEVRSEPAKTLAYNSIDGTYASEVINGKYDVYVTVEADMEINDLALRTGGTPVKVGAEVPLRGKGYASMGYVIEIND